MVHKICNYPLRIGLISRKPSSKLLELRTVNTFTLATTDFVLQGELKAAVTIGSGAQGAGVEVVAEAKGKLFVIEAGAQDQCIGQHARVVAVADARPKTNLE